MKCKDNFHKWIAYICRTPNIIVALDVSLSGTSKVVTNIVIQLVQCACAVCAQTHVSCVPMASKTSYLQMATTAWYFVEWRGYMVLHHSCFRNPRAHTSSAIWGLFRNLFLSLAWDDKSVAYSKLNKTKDLVGQNYDIGLLLSELLNGRILGYKFLDIFLPPNLKIQN